MSSSLQNPDWTTSYTLSNGWTIRGRSKARESTGFCIPEIGLFLDAGVPCRAFKASTILVTHSHWDHVNALSSLLRGLTYIPLVVVPQSLIQRLFGHVKSSWQIKIEDGSKLPYHYQLNEEKRDYTQPFFDPHAGLWMPANPHQSIELNVNGILSQFNHIVVPNQCQDRLIKLKNPHRNKLYATGIKCFHTVADIGYVIYETRMKLKKEYQGLSSQEIAQKSKSGEQVNEPVAFYQLAYLCDTTINVLDETKQDEDKSVDSCVKSKQLDLILNCPTIMIECTFLEKEMEQEATKRGHICWTQLEPFISKHPQHEFILFHFSLRYADDEIKTFFNQLNGGKPANVKLWLNQEVY